MPFLFAEQGFIPIDTIHAKTFQFCQMARFCSNQLPYPVPARVVNDTHVGVAAGMIVTPFSPTSC